MLWILVKCTIFRNVDTSRQVRPLLKFDSPVLNLSDSPIPSQTDNTKRIFPFTTDRPIDPLEFLAATCGALCAAGVLYYLTKRFIWEVKPYPRRYADYTPSFSLHPAFTPSFSKALKTFAFGGSEMRGYDDD